MHHGFDSGPEWLEADGLGGFASGTASGVRTRRYHALLCCATTPPTGRMVLVNGFEVWLERGRETHALCSHVYEPGVVHPDAHAHLASFTHLPWPTWVYALPGGTRIRHEVFVPRGRPACAALWALEAGEPAVLCVRPLMSGRDYHHTHHENPVFDTNARVTTRSDGSVRVRLAPYHGVPAVNLVANGAYVREPVWYRQFRYEAELERGLDFTEDLMAPGVMRFNLRAEREAVLVLRAETPGADAIPDDNPASLVSSWRSSERANRADLRAGPLPDLRRAADAYLARRGLSTTVIAGYPWFTDWGRDTFVALRGLCLATGRLEQAQQILLDWSRYRSGGMMPNRFPDEGAAPEFHSVDAGLWYVIAAYEFVAEARRVGYRLPRGDERAILDAALALVEGCAEGTRLGIAVDPADALLRAGEEGTALTWMDARYDGHAVTPRIGKPVEIQALWINALALTAPRSKELAKLLERARQSFQARFWLEDIGYLADVVDVNHNPGRVDRAIRPNALFAVGGLPQSLVDAERARRVTELAERELWTPMGMRTLAPSDPAYIGRYTGGRTQRDEAYHQGAAWPWLLGPFVEAWVRARADDPAAPSQAWNRFVRPLLEHPDRGGLDHIAEVADGDVPHNPGGCPFQAWSVGEVLRLAKLLGVP